jgi:hypothetical protein
MAGIPVVPPSLTRAGKSQRDFHRLHPAGSNAGCAPSTKDANVLRVRECNYPHKKYFLDSAVYRGQAWFCWKQAEKGGKFSASPPF